VLIALGSLTLWHARLISRGETSIEANINKAEKKRLAEKNKVIVFYLYHIVKCVYM
jgi:palmitoyltransferase